MTIHLLGQDDDLLYTIKISENTAFNMSQAPINMGIIYSIVYN